MKTTRKALILSVLSLAAAMGTASQGNAQVTNASASTLALAGNHTASVRGFGAISVNPAGLAMPGSGFSLALLSGGGRAGFAPVTLWDFAEFQGALVPTSTKEAWLSKIIASGEEQGSVGAQVTLLALTAGNLGFQLSATGSVDATIPPGVAEGVLYGNAGRTGSVTDLSLTGATLKGFVVSTAALSYALPLTDALALGVTGKYIRGHGVAVARSVAGAIESGPIRGTLDFQAATTCTDDTDRRCEQDFANGGSGYGLDLGVMLNLGRITLGGSMQNLVNTFEWDTRTLSYRRGVIDTMEEEEEEEEEVSSANNFDEQLFANAPADMKTSIRDYAFQPSYRLGATLDVTSALTLTGDIHGELGDDGISLGQRSHAGVGAELRAGFVHFRGGVAKITDGMQYGGGASLVLGPVNLSGAVGLQRGEERETVMGQFVLSFGNR
ncbi:MAG: DUF5723 family protein [Longimicrobiales bacterium]|nr:DUF5723 family protein [Longimicrobiales bacterium]